MNSLRLIKGSIFGIVKLGLIAIPVPPIGYKTQLFVFNQATNSFLAKGEKKIKLSKRQIKISRFNHILEQFKTLDHIPALETDKWKLIITDFQKVISDTHPTNETEERELDYLIGCYRQFTDRLNEVFELVRKNSK